MDFCYTFPVVKGIQAGREYYIAMVPLKMLSRLFPNDDEYVMPEYRAQRKLNVARIPEIKKYIIENRNDYVFSALAASIDGDFHFKQSDKNENLGTLDISLDARFLINDGQHRKAAILEALEEDPSLKDETISIVFYADAGLERSQQIFTDLNKHAVKTSNSISELYDSRDDLAVLTRKIIKNVRFLDEYTDKEKDILGKYSSNLFTLNTFYVANKRILSKVGINEDTVKFLTAFWQTVADNIIQWHELENREISKIDLRENYIITQAVVIQALGRLGNYFLLNPKINMTKTIAKLKKINWKRNDSNWYLRNIKANGRMINSENAIILTANHIKKCLGLSLNEDEQQREEKYLVSIKLMLGEKHE